MAKMVIDFPTKVEKLKPKLRRFSTDNSVTIKISGPKPLPNHLRASMGSCHDFCKYGYKPNFPSQSISLQQEKLKNFVLETSNKENKIPRTKELKHKSSVRSDHSTEKQQPKKTFLKSTKNEQIGRNDAGKGVIRPSVPLASLFVTIRTNKRGSKEDSQIKNSLENSKESHLENVPEKIIHVIEPKDENQKADHAMKTRKSVVPIKEIDSSSRSKLKMKRGKALEIKNVEAGPKDQISLNKNVISVRGNLHHQAIEPENTNEDSTNNLMDETTVTKLVNISKNKVKALVDAFETLINNQESESSKVYISK